MICRLIITQYHEASSWYDDDHDEGRRTRDDEVIWYDVMVDGTNMKMLAKLCWGGGGGRGEEEEEDDDDDDDDGLVGDELVTTKWCMVWCEGYRHEDVNAGEIIMIIITVLLINSYVRGW